MPNDGNDFRDYRGEKELEEIKDAWHDGFIMGCLVCAVILGSVLVLVILVSLR